MAQQTLADAVLFEMTRVRDDVLAVYIACAAKSEAVQSETAAIEAQAFAPAIAMMRRQLDAAARALAYQDAVELLSLHALLREWQP